MLKVAAVEEELRGAAVLEWWNGKGAARVLARHGEALVLERATGTACLAEMARTDGDDEACAPENHQAASILAPSPFISRAKPGNDVSMGAPSSIETGARAARPSTRKAMAMR